MYKDILLPIDLNQDSSWKSALPVAIEHARAGASPVALDQSAIGRVSRIDAMQQQALAQNLLSRLTQRQRQLDAALERVEAGAYGLCCACHERIEPERLTADPAVVFCHGCATERR